MLARASRAQMLLLYEGPAKVHYYVPPPGLPHPPLALMQAEGQQAMGQRLYALSAWPATVAHARWPPPSWPRAPASFVVLI